MNLQNLTYTKDQHTVPRCYLKNFSDDGKFIFKKQRKVYTTDEAVEKDISKPHPLSKATVVPDFYTLRKGPAPMLVETYIYGRKVEQNYPKIYNMLIDPNIEGFDMMERVDIFTFFFTLHCRTPKQFQVFYKSVPDKYAYEMDLIKEEYKFAHLLKTVPDFIAAHQFKRIRIVKITDSSQFITSDNPVLIIGENDILKNNDYQEQFNKDNIILVPIDKKHCCIFMPCLDRNGINAEGKLFYNKIERVDVDVSFTQQVNYFMLGSAEKYYYGSEKYLSAFFSLYRLVE